MMKENARTALEAAARLFAAIESKNVAAVADIYADDIEVWHNFSNRCQDKATNLQTLSGLCASVERIDYEVKERLELQDGRVLQRHILHAVPADGEAVSIPACILIRAENGRIRRIDEYLDTGQANRLRQATGRPSL